MSSPRRKRTTTAALGVVALATGTLVAAGPATATAADHTITPDPSYQGQEFEGWGTSLVWFANATGDYPDEIREHLADLLFGDDGLALNLARYNVGGGNAPDVTDYLRAGGAVEGWWQAPEGTTRHDTDWWRADNPDHWNDDADATQRWWLERIKDDIDHWEAFSNSPPWFQTVSGYVSGGFDATDEQLRPDRVDDFAAYLVGVVDRLEAAHGITFDTIDPFNEPNTNYWSTRLGPDGEPVGGRQEGAHIGPQAQQEVIRALAARLAAEETGTDAVISAMDETNPTTFARNWESYPADVRALVDQLNVHTYGTGGRTTVRDIAKGEDKPLWMSEVEGDWGDGQDFEAMAPGLGLAERITDDLRELEPTAWVFWQPVEDYDNMKPGGESERGGNWGSIQLPFDCTAGDTLETCPVYTNQKFNTARNFTHYIKPGDRLIGTDDTASVAAVAAGGNAATVVHTHRGAQERTVTLDLSKFKKTAKNATVTPVVTSASGALVTGEAVPVRDGRAQLTVPGESVTTFLIDGVSGVAKDAALVQPGHTYQLTGVQSGRALTVADDGSGAVISTAVDGDRGQIWTLTPHTKGHDNRQSYVLGTREGNQRFAVRDGAAVLEKDRGRADAAARWILSTTGDGTYTLVNEATGRLLEVSGQATHEGAPVTVWTPNSGANQRWEITDLKR
ncbi:RICIN domain-containing protein [Streptomyces carpaticus]|uniref:glycoside hydrolase n=1 Tax=Streptomyces carpaticus TaxID=285558 RepID=UPI00220E93CB|nr:RICIN domain-containing protein [Streptomyces carpaticus]